MSSDSDFDDTLLGLVGSKANTAGNPSRRKRGGAASTRSDDSDDSFDSAVSASESESHDDDDDGDDAAAEDDEIAQLERELAQLDGETEDDAMLGLTELERENRLSERAERRQALLSKIELKRRVLGTMNNTTITTTTGHHKKRKTRSTAKKPKEKSAGLRKLEQRRRQRTRRARGSDESHSDSEDDDALRTGSDDEDVDYVDRVKRTFTGASSKADRSFVPTLDDINTALVTRQDMIKWLYAPFFESTIRGCFVRLGLGMDKQTRQNIYRVCQVFAVRPYHRSYKVDGVVSKVALVLRHGAAEKEFLIEMLSNSPITQSEFDRWLATMRHDKQRLPTHTEIQAASTALTEARQHVYTHEEIDEIVRKKEQVYNVPKNLVMEKIELVAKWETAKAMAENEAPDADEFLKEEARREADKLHQRIQAISRALGEPSSTDSPASESHPPRGNGGADVWSELNERNRRKNLEEGSLAERLARQAQAKDAHGSPGGKSKRTADPFARIKSVPTHVFVTPGPVAEEGAETSMDTAVGGTGDPISPVGVTGGQNGVVMAQHGEGRTSVQGDVFDQTLAEIDIDI